MRFLVEPLDRSAPFEHMVPWAALVSGRAREAEVERLEVLAAAALVLTARAVLQDVPKRLGGREAPWRPLPLDSMGGGGNVVFDAGSSGETAVSRTIQFRR